MPGRERFDRPDCPYGCGESLPAHLTWDVTECPRCRRPIYARQELDIHEHGTTYQWPPPDASWRLPGAHRWYAVRAEDRPDADPAYLRLEERRRRLEWSGDGGLGQAQLMAAGFGLVLGWIVSLIAAVLAIVAGGPPLPIAVAAISAPPLGAVVGAALFHGLVKVLDWFAWHVVGVGVAGELLATIAVLVQYALPPALAAGIIWILLVA